MNDPVLKISKLKTCIAGTLPVVDGVDCEVRCAETLALLGESGCGKSMLALSIMRLLPAAARVVGGSVRLGNTELLALPEAQMRAVRGGRIGMIFQESATSLNPVYTVGQQIGESLKVHTGLRGKSAYRRTIALLEAVGIPDPRRYIGEYPHQLSGGMKQRVMIAIALAGNPDLLIADEPTTALDVTIQAQVLRLLKSLQGNTGMAVLLITHDLGIAAEVADRVAVMYAGQIVEMAPSRTFPTMAVHPYSKMLLASLPTLDKRGRALVDIKGEPPLLDQSFQGCRFAGRCPSTLEPCRTDAALRWRKIDDEHGCRCILGSSEPVSGEIHMSDANSVMTLESGSAGKLLEVTDLKVYFPIQQGIFKRTVGHVKAVDGVSVSIPFGRTLAIVGESGCGKTTLAKGILQLQHTSAGKVLFDGVELTSLSAAQLRRKRSDFQIIFQDPYASMNPRMLIEDILAEGLRAQRLQQNAVSRRRALAALLDQVGLQNNSLNRYPHEFSGGQRQRICIARALAVRPKLIVCDEPTSALDVLIQAQILNLLREFQRKFNISYLFITHNISIVAWLAQEVAVMYLGRIVERGGVEEVLRQPRHPYTQALLSAVPSIDVETKREFIPLKGDLPSPASPPKGCHFHQRCRYAKDQCRTAYPDQQRYSDTHSAHCFFKF
jgi:peptide/nickel transport system ATP-binding protein